MLLRIPLCQSCWYCLERVKYPWTDNLCALRVPGAGISLQIQDILLQWPEVSHITHDTYSRGLSSAASTLTSLKTSPSGSLVS